MVKAEIGGVAGDGLVYLAYQDPVSDVESGSLC